MGTKLIADVVKQSIRGIKPEQMYNLMLEKYKTLRLIDNNNKWISPEFEKISSTLLPKNLTEEKCDKFIDVMASFAEKNPYLTSFLNSVEHNHYDRLSEKVQKEGKEVFPKILAYTFALELLTKNLTKNPKLLEESYNHFRATRKKEDTFKHLPFFHKIKLLSIETPIKYYLDYEKTLKPKGSPLLSQLTLSANILEATISDFFERHYSNAKTGWILATNAPPSKKYPDERVAGKTNSKIPMPKEWEDLYQTWNMAFVSKFQDYPYIIPKLLIPQVANYQENPNKYLFNRSVALYLYLNFTSFDYSDKLLKNEKPINWYDEKLSEDWGKSNSKMAKIYEKEYSKIARLPREKFEEAVLSKLNSDFSNIAKERSKVNLAQKLVKKNNQSKLKSHSLSI